MYIPDNIDRFLDEYGPIIVDMLLALPFIRLLRTLFTQHRNEANIKQNRPSICCLPDELILEICSILYLSGPQTTLRHPRRRGRWIFDSKLALLNFSMTSKRMRNICAPVILSHVDIGGYRGWRRAFRSLEAAERSQALQHAKVFFLRVNPGYNTVKLPPKRFAPRFARAMLQYNHVFSLQIDIPHYSAATLQKGFEQCSLKLPNIRVLILSAHLEWLIRMCPNLESVSTSGPSWLITFNDSCPIEQQTEQPIDFIKAAGGAPKLRQFEMHENWSTELVEEVLKFIPNIQSLAIPGHGYLEGISDLIEPLQRLCKLKTLVLTELSGLDVGYYAPRCGNAYLEPDGDSYREEVAQRRRDALAYVGKLVFGKLEGVEELWVGDHDKATRDQNGYGSREIVWSREHRQVPSDMQ